MLRHPSDLRAASPMGSVGRLEHFDPTHTRPERVAGDAHDQRCPVEDRQLTRLASLTHRADRRAFRPVGVPYSDNPRPAGSQCLIRNWDDMLCCRAVRHCTRVLESDGVSARDRSEIRTGVDPLRRGGATCGSTPGPCRRVCAEMSIAVPLSDTRRPWVCRLDRGRYRLGRLDLCRLDRTTALTCRAPRGCAGGCRPGWSATWVLRRSRAC